MKTIFGTDREGRINNMNKSKYMNTILLVIYFVDYSKNKGWIDKLDMPLVSMWYLP